jgi:hypothetical protein
MLDEPVGALKVSERARLPRASQAALKRDALIAIRRRFGKDPTGRGTAWIFEYDAGEPAVLQAT